MLRISELAARLHVCILLNLYGTGKIVGGQFYRYGKLPEEVAIQTLGEVETYALGWTFMGHSYLYILFIGLSQIVGGWLLLWERTKFLGILILIPILANIIVFDIIYLPTKGALASAVIYMLELFFVLWVNREKLSIVWDKLISTNFSIKGGNTSVLKRVFLALVLTGIIFGVEQLLVNLIGH